MKKPQRRDLGMLIVHRAPVILYVWATVAFAVGIFRGETSLNRYLALKDSEVVLTKAVADLETENNKFEDEIFKLKKSKSYARKVLRDKYHVTESDEKIIYFAD